ncbi:MAG: cytochrome c biogenesis protein [Caldimicrobium sp.]|nr:cytochrome c biogenesis protein [Caldimicrobium sp.]MCX7874068.1 cytochrome c biogenesis protein [Caldimicrobium sp.]MDW8093892.1 cytochrome c biogenesis protein CcsA [Caldimicrobium sp.]
MKSLFLDLAFFIYLVSWIGFIFYFKTLDRKALQITQGVLLAGALFHFIYVLLFIKELYEVNYFTFREILSLFSFLLVMTYFYFSFSRDKAYTLGTFLMPLPLFFLLLSYLYFREAPLSPFSPYIKSFWFPIHVISSLLSHAFLLTGLSSSVMYLLQEREIKRKHFGHFFRKLPPLNSLERISERALYQGFFFLTIGLLSGALWSESAFGDYWRWSAKEVISLSLWLIYAGMLHQRILIGWRGKRLAYMFILGSSLWFFTFFVVNFYFKGFHTYGN